jgi:hypothetical protein
MSQVAIHEVSDPLAGIAVMPPADPADARANLGLSQRLM